MLTIIWKTVRLALTIILLMLFLANYFGIVFAQQNLRIWHEGEIAAGWRIIPDGNRFSAILVSLVPQEIAITTEEDRRAIEYLTFLEYGGAIVEAGPYNFQSYLERYVSDVENSDYISEYRRSQKQRIDYLKDKYGENLPPGISQINIGPHQALVYSTVETGTSHYGFYQSLVFRYFISVQHESKDGALIRVVIRHVDEKSPFTLNHYEAEVEKVIANLRFSFDTDTGRQTVVGPGDPPPPESSWDVVVGGIAAVAAAAAVIAARSRKKKVKPQKKEKAEEKAEEKEEQDSDTDEVAGYILQLSTDEVLLQENEPQFVNVQCWEVNQRGEYRQAPYAVLQVQGPPADSNINVSPVNGQGSLDMQIVLTGIAEQTAYNISINASAGGESIGANVKLLVSQPEYILVVE